MGADRLGRRARAVGVEDRRSARGGRTVARRRDRRRPSAQRRGAVSPRRCTARSASRTSITASAAQMLVHHDGFASHVDLENANTIITLGPPALGARAGARPAHPQGGLAQRRAADLGRRPLREQLRPGDARDERRRVARGDRRQSGPRRADLGRRRDRRRAGAAPRRCSKCRAPTRVRPLRAARRRRTAAAPKRSGCCRATAALHTRAMLEAARDGKLDVLAILGANPVLRFPDRALVEEALRATPFVVVTDLFLTETAEFANLDPAGVQRVREERHDDRSRRRRAAGDRLGPSARRRPRRRRHHRRCSPRRLGVALPLPDEIEAKIRELVRTPPPPPVPYCTPRDGRRAGRRAARDPARVHLHRRRHARVRHDASPSCARRSARAASIPTTARALDLADGDIVDAAGANGADAARALTVHVDERVAAGAVALVDGIVVAPLNALGPATARPLAEGAGDRVSSVPIWLIVLIKAVIVLFVVITVFAYSMLAERKVMGWMQLRPGPNRVGPVGAAAARRGRGEDDVQGRPHAGDGGPADLPARAVHLADLRDGHVRDHPVLRQRRRHAVVGRKRQRRDPVRLLA